MRTCQDCLEVEAAPGRSRCWTCYGTYRRGYEAGPDPRGGARILVVDIETSPNIVLAWDSQLRYGNIGPHQIQEPTRMLCFAAKWVGEDETFIFSEWGDGRDLMLAAAWDLLHEADIVVHFNGKSFDTPHLNRELAEAGLLPPSPFKQVDLCHVARKMFRFPSNKLDYVSQALDLDGKMETGGFGLWVRVLEGDREAQNRMADYNERDTVLTEELFERLRPWIPNLPNLNIYSGDDACPGCGSSNVTQDGWAYTPLSKFKRYVCQDCGLWSRDGKRQAGANLRGVAL